MNMAQRAQIQKFMDRDLWMQKCEVLETRLDDCKFQLERANNKIKYLEKNLMCKSRKKDNTDALKRKLSRIDVIGQNGNDGDHYERIGHTGQRNDQSIADGSKAIQGKCRRWLDRVTREYFQK